MDAMALLCVPIWVASCGGTSHDDELPHGAAAQGSSAAGAGGGSGATGGKGGTSGSAGGSSGTSAGGGGVAGKGGAGGAGSGGRGGSAGTTGAGGAAAGMSSGGGSGTGSGGMPVAGDCDGPEDCASGRYCVWGLDPKAPNGGTCVTEAELPDPLKANCCFDCDALPLCVLCNTEDDCPETLLCVQSVGAPNGVSGCRVPD